MIRDPKEIMGRRTEEVPKNMGETRLAVSKHLVTAIPETGKGCTIPQWLG